MRSIDIQTTQNVTISYEIAVLRDRILALIIDWVVLALSLLIVFLLYVSIDSNPFNSTLGVWMFYFVIPVMVFFYTLALETILNGQTLGKKVMRIKVIKLDGRQLKFFDNLLRWSFRLMDIWMSMGALAAIMSTSTPNGQRLGGLVSNTTVVKLNPTLNISLSDLQQINSLENYEPQYPGVKNFKEQDMLLIKQAIERYAKYKNTAHREAILELVQVVQEKLGLEEIPKGKITFLKTLIRDYIVLTR